MTGMCKPASRATSVKCALKGRPDGAGFDCPAIFRVAMPWSWPRSRWAEAQSERITNERRSMVTRMCCLNRFPLWWLRETRVKVYAGCATDLLRWLRGCQDQFVAVPLAFLTGRVLSRLGQSLQEIGNLCRVPCLPKRDDEMVQGTLIGWLLLQDQPAFLRSERILARVEIVLGQHIVSRL